jgi:hypothetical protein
MNPARFWIGARGVFLTVQNFRYGTATPFGAPNTENRDAHPAPNWWTD